ncbi:hypothetical protein [Synergistes jonesii]|uniref:Uncharacterized protein n=1 Tax=Synergistes jonesii TaxID=2754 RepID=A0A073J6H2_9BACT|nr:hypothetical protein [Synergistes jonesii]KEJ93327.1 hypothetical protein EH55_08465 [Synergistes jonesii]OFB65085.1 hypothetical protein JS73_00970 [Synergistes jonesii]OFB65968.1 hypothetical protein JS72_00520 [Synergistes jonesii]OFB66358.1 hypothetical protein JS79_00980 [Synergistes jonesii]OFB69073.1 hypothetical protein JS78_00980 [Synergistes jonesii]
MSIRTLQTSFASGEISPALFGRPDLAKYAAGLRRCENFVIHPHGGITKRAGMRFVAKAKGKCRLVEFEYSIDQTYVLEFGDRYVRFYRDGRQIQSGSEPYEVATPYSAADIDGLSFTQSADVLYIVHKNHRPRELYRVNDTNWVLADFAFKNGPWRGHGADIEAVAVGLSAKTGNIVLTASAPLFKSGHVGGLFSVIHHVDEVSVKSSGDAGGAWASASITGVQEETGSSGEGGPTYSYYYTVPEAYRGYFAVGRRCRVYSAVSGDGYTDCSVSSLSEEGVVTFSPPAPVRVGAVDCSVFVPASSGGRTLEVTAYKGWRLESGGFWGGTVFLEYYDEDESAWVKYKTYISESYAEGTSSSCGNAKNYSDQDVVDKPTRLRVRAASFTTFVPEGNSEEDRGYFQLAANAAEHRAVMKITAVYSPTSAAARVLTAAAATKATVNWEEGAWSDAQGWPSAAGFYQERLIMGSTREQPQSWWMSKTGDYYDFGASFEALDDEALSGTLVSRKMFDLRYFVSLGDLLVMTSGGEWKLSSGAAGGAVTPSNVDVGLQGNRGCAAIEPIVVGNMILFVQARGLRIRDLGYEYASDSYTGNDLTVLARHLFEGREIVDWAFALEPDSMCWAVRDDGLLIGMTYIREHEVVAWARYPTDGVVERVASVISRGSDLVYLCVRRGAERFIEVMEPMEASTAAEAFMVDAGITRVSASAQREVSGLSHLNGRTVCANADGDAVEGLVVEDGRVMLPEAARVVHVGLPYAAVAETLDLSYQRRDGAQLTRKSRVASVRVRVERTRGLSAGAAAGGPGNAVYTGPGVSEAQKALLFEVPERSDEESGEATRLFSCDHEIFFDSSYDEGRMVLYAPHPLPCSVLALTADVAPAG